METGNSGVVGVVESRTNINAMKEYYRQEYKKLVDKQNKNNDALFHNKWKVRIGGFTTRVGLFFTQRGAVRTLSRLGSRVVGHIAEKVMNWKNKRDNKKLEEQKEQLTADFINAEGIFSKFNVVNNTSITMDDEMIESSEKGFSR